LEIVDADAAVLEPPADPSVAQEHRAKESRIDPRVPEIANEPIVESDRDRWTGVTWIGSVPGLVNTWRSGRHGTA
jgi:hypothetical protein